MAQEYLPRIADDLLRDRLGYAGGVLIRGAKWCGKTRTAERQAASALYLQDRDTRASKAWRPSLRARTRVSATPTRHFVDPSLAAAALGASPHMLLADVPTLGLLFESLCVRDLRAYVSAMRGELYHYHDMTGLEADAVAVVPDGRWGAFEMKTNPRVVDDGAASLKKLAAKVDESVGKMAFLAVITASGYAYRRKDGVYVIPISCLAP